MSTRSLRKRPSTTRPTSPVFVPRNGQSQNGQNGHSSSHSSNGNGNGNGNQNGSLNNHHRRRSRRSRAQGQGQAVINDLDTDVDIDMDSDTSPARTGAEHDNEDDQEDGQKNRKSSKKEEATNFDPNDPDVWHEPPVRKLPPSYQDHKGLERVGVLELQQPLGELPSAKLLQRLKLHLPRPVARTPASEQHQQHQQQEEVQQQPQQPQQQEQEQKQADEAVVTPSVEDPEPEPEPMEDTEAAQPPVNLPPPADHQQPPSPIIPSPPRGRPTKRDIAEMRRSLNRTEATPSPPPSPLTSAQLLSHQQQRPVSIQEHLRQDRVQNYVETAIQEAEQKGDHALIPGLRKMRDRAVHQRELLAVLDAVAHSEPTEEQLSIFRKYIKKGVKRHKRKFAEISGGSEAAAAAAAAAAATATAAVPPGVATTAAAEQRMTRSRSHGEFADLPNSQLQPTSPSKRQPSSTTTSRFTLDQSSARPTRQSSNNSSASRPAKMQAREKRRRGQAGSIDPAVPTNARSRSNSASSSLSSAKSIPEEFGPLASAAAAAAASASAGVATQGTATNSRTRSAAQPPSKNADTGSHEVGKLPGRKSKARKEAVSYDPVELEERRQRYLTSSFQDYNDQQFPEIDDRHHVPEDQLLSPSSRRPENFVPSPPVVHPSPILHHQQQETQQPQQQQQQQQQQLVQHDDPMVNSWPPHPEIADPSRGYTPETSSEEAAWQAAVLEVQGEKRKRNTEILPARKSARVMISPNKPKNGAVTARMSRSGHYAEDAHAHAHTDPDPDAEDNDEFCASCGGGGILLCCDGCTKSMHHRCLIPPLDASKEVVGEWFCPVCVSRRSGQAAPQITGLLGKVIQHLDSIIPTAFALPHQIRDYFEGIRTGENGEYEEYGGSLASNQQVPKINRAGFIDEPNYKELRDSKGKLITCYRCGKISGGRDIIPCSYCPARWHLDCCDPPLAVPPRKRAGDKSGINWRCPLHVEHDLAAIGSQDDDAAAGDLGRQPRPRRPKNAIPLDVDLSRGFRNNGVIDVDLEPDDDQLADAPSIKDVDMNGQVFRLREKGIRLDFIDRVKRSWYEDQIYPELIGRPNRLKRKLYQASDAVTRHDPTSVLVRQQEPDFYRGSQALAVVETAKANAALRYKTFAEQQTVLGLVQMCSQSQQQEGQKDADQARRPSHFSGDAVADLTNQLIIDAPPGVEQSVQQTEKEQLLWLQDLIGRRLRVLQSQTLSQNVQTGAEAGAEAGTNPRQDQSTETEQPDSTESKETDQSESKEVSNQEAKEIKYADSTETATQTATPPAEAETEAPTSTSTHDRADTDPVEVQGPIESAAAEPDPAESEPDPAMDVDIDADPRAVHDEGHGNTNNDDGKADIHQEEKQEDALAENQDHDQDEDQDEDQDQNQDKHQDQNQDKHQDKPQDKDQGQDHQDQDTAITLDQHQDQEQDKEMQDTPPGHPHSQDDGQDEDETIKEGKDDVHDRDSPSHSHAAHNNIGENIEGPMQHVHRHTEPSPEL